MTINDSTPVDAFPISTKVTYTLFTKDDPQQVAYEVEVELKTGLIDGREIVGLSIFAVEPRSHAELTYVMPLMSTDEKWSPPKEEVISSVALLDDFRGIVERILPEARADLLGPLPESAEEA